MVQKREIYADLVVYAIYFTFFFGLTSMAFINYFPEYLYPLWALSFAGMFVVNAFIRRKIKHFLLKFLLQMIAPAVFIFLVPIYLSLPVAIMLAIMSPEGSPEEGVGEMGHEAEISVERTDIARKTIMQNQPSSGRMSEAGVVICHLGAFGFAILSWLGWLRENPFMQWVYLPLFFILLLSGVAYHRILRMNIVLIANIRTATVSQRQSMRKILRADRMLSLGVSVVLITLMIFFRVAFIDHALTLFNSSQREDAHFEEVHEYTPGQGHDSASINGEEQPMWDNDPATPWIGTILDIILMFFAVPIVICVLIVLLMKLLRNIQWRGPIFFRRAQGLVSASDDTDDECEFLSDHERTRKKRRYFWQKAEPEQPIRKQFRKKIVQHKRRGAPITSADTPSEMAVRITAEDIDALVAQYQEVRYR